MTARLDQVDSQQVVRHAKNGNFYRVERPERGKMRIFSLELFPSGLLIPKSTPTLVDSDIEVVVLGVWREDMTAEGRPKHTRRWYEKKLAELEAKLIMLTAAYDELPVNGRGPESRGSWANKIKGVQHHITTYRRGLGFERTEPTTVCDVSMDTNVPAYSANDYVQLPSGRPAIVNDVSDKLASVRTRYQGEDIRATVPLDVLQPWSYARVCTV